MAGGYEGEEGGEGLNLGGAEEKEKEEEEENAQDNSQDATKHQSKGWNDKRNAWENWQYDSPGAYYMGEQSQNPFQGIWEEWNPAFYALYKDKEEKVDAGEIVETGFKVKTRKKFKNTKIKPELMALRSTENEMETVKVDAVMDSGAFDIVIPKEMMGGNEIRQTKASKAGYNLYDVQGGEVKNLGEGDLKGVSEDGIAIEFTAQVGEGIKKMLLSVKRACKSGNMVIFGANMKAIRDLAKMDSIEDNVIVGTKSGIKSEIKEKNEMYVYPMTITRKKKNRNDMEIGMLKEMGEKDDDEEENEEQEGEWKDGLWTPF